MRVPARFLMVVLLSLLLPVQGALAYARSVAMTGKQLSETVTEISSQRSLPSMELAHAGHHHDAHAAKPGGSAPVERASGHAPGKHASNACDNCAKCCLTGAAAPPSVNPPSMSPDMVRTVSAASSARLSGFIPDGPERPPRSPSA